MPEGAVDVEVYVLLGGRSAAEGLRFLDAFLPKRRPLADEYVIPEFADEPVERFTDAVEFMEYMERETSQTQSLYWQSGSVDGPQQAMLFYLSDGGLIGGLAVTKATADATFARARRAFGEDRAYMTEMEGPPPDSRDAFLRRCGA